MGRKAEVSVSKPLENCICMFPHSNSPIPPRKDQIDRVTHLQELSEQVSKKYAHPVTECANADCMQMVNSILVEYKNFSMITS